MSGKDKKKALIYTAGLFDGRGTITLWKPRIADNATYRNKYTWKYELVRIVVTKKRFVLLDYLQNTYGGCVSNADKKGYRKYWCLTCASAVNFLRDLRPYVKVPLRQRQIDYILSMPRFADTFRPTKAEIKARKAFEKGWKELKKC